MSQESNMVAISPALSFGLNFNSHDLRANQQGRMTSRQVHLLRAKRRQLSASSTWVGRLKGGLCYLIYGVTPRKHQWNLIGADITATITNQQQGQVILPKMLSGQQKGLPSTQYEIVVKRKQIKVDRRALRSFRDRNPYVIYYAPHSRQALSAEVHHPKR